LLTVIDSLDELAGRYAAILCDVWGVVHNGVEAFDPACAALRRARQAGAAVVLMTNAPRPFAGVVQQLAALGVPSDAWDRVVTSGDVTRKLIAEGPRKVFHIGPDRDESLFDGLDVELVEEQDASVAVCTGLYDDTIETPDDYTDVLRRIRSRDLPFVCANPDIVVERGDQVIWCAGALARDYGLLGGRTLIAGKPHRPIYEASLAAAGEVLDRVIGRSDALAIGDGMLTDIKGACDNGIDVLFVTGGIHSRDYGDVDAPDRDRLDAFLTRHGHAPVAAITRLR
jgi:HAD superfamily hydrolase (TIGR01459 family)